VQSRLTVRSTRTAFGGRPSAPTPTRNTRPNGHSSPDSTGHRAPAARCSFSPGRASAGGFGVLSRHLPRLCSASVGSAHNSGLPDARVRRMVAFNDFAHSLQKRDGRAVSQARDHSGWRYRVHGAILTCPSNKQTQRSLPVWICFIPKGNAVKMGPDPSLDTDAPRAGLRPLDGPPVGVPRQAPKNSVDPRCTRCQW